MLFAFFKDYPTPTEKYKTVNFILNGKNMVHFIDAFRQGRQLVCFCQIMQDFQQLAYFEAP